MDWLYVVIAFLNKQLNLRGFMAGLRTDLTVPHTPMIIHRLAVRFILCFIVSLFTVLTTTYRTASFITCLVTADDWLAGTNGPIKIHGNYREAFIGVL